jgi:ABC-type polar amino acid transport system ATPase subunit
MDQGEIVETGTPEQFFSQTRTERARVFLDSVMSHHH